MPLPANLQAIVDRLAAGGRPETIPPTTLPSEREQMLDQIAAAASRDPRVKAVADGLYAMLAARLGRAPRRPELLQWLMDSVHLLADYAPDPPGEEMFQSVQWTIGGGCGAGLSPITGRQKGCADCEDQATLLVALCLALGIRARVKWIDQEGSPLNHVSAMAELDGGTWVCTDATIPGARPGETPNQALDRVGPGFRSRIFGIENAAGGLFAPAGAVRPRFRPSGEGDRPSFPAAPRRLHVLHMPGNATLSVAGATIDARLGAWDAAPNPEMGWSIVLPDYVPSGTQVLRIAPPSGNPRTDYVEILAYGTTHADFATMTPTAIVTGTPVGDGLRGTLRILAMIPNARVWIDSEDRTAEGAWIAGATPYAWGDLSLAAGAHRVDVIPQAPSDGPALSRSVTIAPGVLNTVATAWLPPGSAPAATPSRIVIVGMPPGGAVTVDGVAIPYATSMAMTPAPSTGVEGLLWPVPAAVGRRVVVVTPPAGGGPARSATVDVPAAGASVRFNGGMTAADAIPVRSSEIEVQHIIPGSRLYLGTADVTETGRWVDLPSATFAIPAWAGPAALRVVSPTGEARVPRVPITVPAAGAFTVDWSTMAPEVSITPDASVPATSFRLLNAPAGATIALDGLDLVAPWVRPLEDGSIKVAALPGPHIVRVTPASGPARSGSVAVPTVGGVDVDFNTLGLVDGDSTARTGRVVVRGAPAGITPARVVAPGATAYNPATSQPLAAQPGGYLAVTWPVGPARLQVGAFDVPVTVVLAIDSVYDYTPEGLVFQPLIADARVAPNAGTGPTGATASQGSVVLTGVPAIDGTTEGLGAALGGESQYIAELHGGAETVTLRAVGGVFSANAAPAAYTLTVYLETSQPGRPATRRPVRSADVTLVAGQTRSVAWSAMTVVAATGSTATGSSPPAPVDDAHARMTVVGLPDGWAIEVDGLAAQPAEGLTRGAHTVVLRNAQGLVARRDVVLRNAEETVDVAYDIARALQFAAGHDGVVNVTEAGLRNGYASTFTLDTNRAARWLTDAELRRVLREFDVVGAWRDAAGRMPVARYLKGAGLTVVPMTQAELLAAAKNLLKRGKVRTDGTYPLDLRLPTP